MDAIEAILTRRSISRLSKEAPSKQTVEELLNAAVMAPNHHLTEPWRFIVLTGGELEAMGTVMAGRVEREYEGDANLDKRMAAEQAKPLRAPVIVTFVYVPTENPKVIEMEDRYAMGAAIENFLVAAHASGLGAYIRTGPAASDEGVRKFLELGAGEEVAGFIYLGYVDEPPKQTPNRSGTAGRIKWRGWT